MRTRALWVAAVWLLLGSLGDVVSSQMAVESGLGHERNPVMASVVGSVWAFAVVKVVSGVVGVACGRAAAAVWGWSYWPVVVVLALLACVEVGVVIGNVGVSR